ncbi:MAG: hypothetical protein AB7K36_07465 [Chloroflexota bacterium]
MYNRPRFGAGKPERDGWMLFQVDLRRDRFMKLWRVSGDRVDATAAIIRHGEAFTAAVHYQYADGRSRSWSWRPRSGSYLTGREIVRCMNSIDRGFRAIPGVHVRIDFPQNASREDQKVILMDYGLHRLFLDAADDGDRPLADQSPPEILNN